VAAVRGLPYPKIHDEYSYLLAGDTFARGRMANPAPAMPKPFETVHTLVRPTYASKYPPGQGAFLAIGFWLGHPILGVWISLAFAAAAISWLISHWLNLQWGWMAGLLCAVHLNTAQYPGSGIEQFAYWGQSYWGGGVAAAGGALLLGGLVPALRRPKARHLSIMVVGLLLLANTRPFEGLVLSLAPCSLVLWRIVLLVRRHGQGRFARVLVPPGIVLILSIALTASYNATVTGSPWILVLVHRELEFRVL
jgi:hypothetical protein